MTQDILASLAGGALALAQAEQLAGSEALSDLGFEGTGPCLSGRWHGDPPRPYRMRLELGRRPPRARCSCSSRARPCKHVLALLARWVRSPRDFEARGQLEAFASPPPAPLPSSPRHSWPGLAPPDAASAPFPAVVVLDRALAGQRLGLERARTLLEGWVIGGLDHLSDQAMREAHRQIDALEALELHGVSVRLRALLERVAQGPAGDEDHEAQVAMQLAGAWTLITEGLAWVARRDGATGAPADPEQLRADAALQTALGRQWSIAELRAMGEVRALTLIELHWSRRDDSATRARVETRLLFEPRQARWFQERRFTPMQRLGRARPQSWSPRPLEVSVAQVWPTAAGRPDAALPRIRWSTDAARSRPATPEDWRRMLAVAMPLEALLRRHAELGQRPWYDRLAHPALLQVQRLERAGGSLWSRDPTGARCQLLGPADALATLATLGVPPGTAAAAVWVEADPLGGAPRFSLLALLTPMGAVRLAG